MSGEKENISNNLEIVQIKTLTLQRFKRNKQLLNVK